MKQLTLKRELLGATLTVQAVHLPAGLQVSLYGGTLPHIGAVSVADPQGNITTRQFPSHKDGLVSERWVKALSEAGYLPAVVVAGIHYDNLTCGQIAEVLALTDNMLDELLNTLGNEDGERIASN